MSAGQPLVTTASMRPRIVGGMFGLPLELDGATRPFPYPTDNAAELANGRCALVLLIELLKPRHVHLPAYLCPSIIAAVRKTGVPFSYLATDYDLRIVPGELDRVGPGDLVDLIDYFGFRTDPAVLKRVRAQGAWLLEDACQALLTEGVGSDADFVLLTPRKFVGIPDAGILISQRPEVDLRSVPLAPPPLHWWMMTLSAVVLRREFDRHGGDRLWFQQYQALEEGMPLGRYAMSDLSRFLLGSAFDYEAIARTRRQNFRLLAKEFGHLAIWPELPDPVVPLGFPVRLANRDEVLSKLYAEEIYPPVHWPFPGILPRQFETSYRLQGDIMMLPCDQRCGPEEMRRIIDIVAPAAVPAPS